MLARTGSKRNQISTGFERVKQGLLYVGPENARGDDVSKMRSLLKPNPPMLERVQTSERANVVMQRKREVVVEDERVGREGEVEGERQKERERDY